MLFCGKANSQEDNPKLKLTHFSLSMETCFFKDKFDNKYYLRDYAKNPSEFDMDLHWNTESPLTNNFLRNHHFYSGKFYQMQVGFTPLKEHREINFGVSFSTAAQTIFSNYQVSMVTLDTLTVTTSNGDEMTYTLDSLTTDDKEFQFKSQNLLLSAEYLFKTGGKSFQFYAGTGLKLGFSVNSQIVEQIRTDKYQLLRDTNNHDVYSMPYPSFQQSEYSYTQIHDTKTILYFTPYIPFGIRLKLSQQENWLSHFSLDLHASVGFEAQLMKPGPIMIRYFGGGGVGLRYVI